MDASSCVHTPTHVPLHPHSLAYPAPPPVPLGSGGRRRCSQAPSATSLLQMRRDPYQLQVTSRRAEPLPNQQPRPSPTGSTPTLATRRPGFESQALHSFLWFVIFTVTLTPWSHRSYTHPATWPTALPVSLTAGYSLGASSFPSRLLFYSKFGTCQIWHMLRFPL